MLMTKYDLIYADPPWEQTKGGKRSVRPRQGRELDYPVMTLSDIENVLSSYTTSTMFLWTIDKFLFEAQSIGEKLGYKLHTRIIWDKENGVAPAFTVRYSHEYLLWMYKSPMPKIAKNARGRFTTVLRERSVRHSQKPNCAYDMIEALYPKQTKIELFARQRRNGWDAWSNELEN